ncbi:MAG: hypothetical protein SF187_23620 [Deltaproteobacteria bacterium]|nr:hypothetical protein [Deltaproteobacteria bacterium]
MHIQGDIKIWSDGHKVCARLEADGPEGPIVIQASAPIGPVRRKMARVFARQGVTVSGADPAFAAKVQQVARRKALKRLQRMAPGAFRKGGLGPYLAQQELLKRKKRRRALAGAGRPVGAKPVGPLPAKKTRPAPQNWRARMRATARGPAGGPRALLPATPKKVAALMAPSSLLVRPSIPRPIPSRSPGGGRGGGSAHGSSSDRPGAAAREEDGLDAASEARDEQSQAPTGQDEEYAEGEADAGQDAGDGGEGDEADAEDEESEGSDEGAEQEGESDGVSGYGFRGRRQRFDERRQLQARRNIAIKRLRAAMRLLLAAYHDPDARQRIVDIAAMAGEGHPGAKKSFKALAVAHKLHKKAQVRSATKALAPRRPVYGKALATSKAKPQNKALIATITKATASRASSTTNAKPKALTAPSPPFTPGTPADAVRWWDILAAWRRGMG